MATSYGLVVPNIKKVQSLSILEVTSIFILHWELLSLGWMALGNVILSRAKQSSAWQKVPLINECKWTMIARRGKLLFSKFCCMINNCMTVLINLSIFQYAESLKSCLTHESRTILWICFVDFLLNLLNFASTYKF